MLGYNLFTKTLDAGGYLWVDEKQRKWALPTKLPFGLNYAVTPETKVFDYTDIIEYEVITDNKTVAKGGSGIGDAILNGITWNTVGVAVLSTGKKETKSICRNLSIKITTSVPEHSLLYIKLITSDTDRSSFAYKIAIENAEKIISILNIIAGDDKLKNSKKSKVDKAVIIKESAPVSVADEIKKYKELLDMGAITEEEFEKKKKQLLEQ